MANSTLSEFDKDRVVVTLRRLGRMAEDLRREYPDALEPAFPAGDADLRATDVDDRIERVA